MKLDNAEVTAAEREQASALNFVQIFNENPSYVNQTSSKQRATTPNTKHSAYQNNEEKKNYSVLSTHDSNRQH